MPTITLIDTPSAVHDLAKHLRDHSELAFDTEFHPEGKYRPEPMLLQLGTRNEVFLVDPLAPGIKPAISELLSELCRKDVTLIGHALRSDMKILYRLCGEIPKQVVDTQIAAAFLGFGGSVSLESLARDEIGASMDKSHTMANWAVRPLPGPLRDYAAGDVGFMLNLWSSLRDKLVNRHRLEWVKEECLRLISLSALQDNDPESAWKSVENRSKVSGRSLVLLRFLAAERERMAQDWNSPPKRILPDSALIDLAKRGPSAKRELANTGAQRTSHVDFDRYADHWLDAIRRAKAAPIEPYNEITIFPTAAQDSALKLIRLFISDLARSAQLAPELLLSGMDRQLSLLVTSTTSDSDQLRSTLGISGWRAEMLIDPVWQLISGRLKPRFVGEVSGLQLKWNED